MRETRAVAATDIGKSRRINEDSFKLGNALGLWIVADGMGGHDYGKQASDIACSVIAEQYKSGSDITASIRAAHAAIQRQAAINRASRGMGSTVVVLQQNDDGFAVSWAGDSRAYLRMDDDFVQLTTDHSFVQQLLDHQIITKQEALTHPKRNLLTSSLGVGLGEHDLQINTLPLPHIHPPAEILLCTDGLTDCVSDNDIHAILQREASPAERLRHLIDAANQAGGRDNITVVLVSIA